MFETLGNFLDTSDTDAFVKLRFLQSPYTKWLQYRLSSSWIYLYVNGSIFLWDVSHNSRVYIRTLSRVHSILAYDSNNNDLCCFRCLLLFCSRTQVGAISTIVLCTRKHSAYYAPLLVRRFCSICQSKSTKWMLIQERLFDYVILAFEIELTQRVQIIFV